MSANSIRRSPMTCAAMFALFLAACGGDGGNDNTSSTSQADHTVTIASTGTNAVSFWTDIAAKTVNASSAVTSTAEEQRTVYAVDMATVQVAVYDAVSAIDGRYKPYAITPTTPAAGASMPAATAAATYGVLRVLFPDRPDQYQAAYTSYLASIPDGDAKIKGLAIGAEVAAGTLVRRANDGRSVVLAAYVPGTAPGKYRGTNPVLRFVPSIKPFALTSANQFRPGGPPTLDSAAYATDFNETKALGSATSTTRTADQLDKARFHTEPPNLLWTRNFRRFAESTTDLAEAARLLAFIYVVHADANIACFEAKYAYDAWRPTSAITLADTDNNPATITDAAWTPVVPTPPHPEYPAAHGCAGGGFVETLRQYYGTRNVAFSFDSTVTANTHSFATVDAFTGEIQIARIAGGMHFRFSMVDGLTLGNKVAQWTAQRYFGPRN
ncbi:MAG: vanadium-dependent haloperoxidase [Burkholderiaceae bacterium]